MYKERKLLYAEIEKFTDSKVICYVTGDRANAETQIGPDAIEYFVEHLDSIGKTKKISLILYSRGGHTLAGWSIVNLIRQFCKEFQVIISSKAHSTATLIALGADSIIMTKQATLGPIDPSVNGPLNPQAPGGNPLSRISISVESINGFIELAKSWGVKKQQEISNIILDLAKFIHPVVLGNVFRSRSQIRMLGKRLLLNHMQDKNKIKKLLDFLCSESGSHDYTIYRREASNELGLKIIKPNDEQYKVIKALHDDYTKELELLIAFDPNFILGNDNQQDYNITRAFVESISGGSTKFISRGTIRRTQIPGPLPGQSQDAAEDRRLFEGWINE